MNHRLLLCLFLIGFLTACQPAAADSLASSTPNMTQTTVVRSSWTPIPVIDASTKVRPTITPLPSSSTPTVTLAPTDTSAPTATNTPSSTPTPRATAIPTNTPRPTLTLVPTIAPTVISTNIPGPFGGDPATWTPPAPTPRLADHFVLQRPIGSSDTNYWQRNYSYGSTDGGQRQIHHGLDFLNPQGTPILAAADGVVYYAGQDLVYGPKPDFYGNVIVIQHTLTDGIGQPIYTLYGHLSSIGVQTGQRVKIGQQIGLVGSTGIAIGAHVHLEVRVGKPEDYNSSMNPELWVLPFTGNGVLAGRVTDLHGATLYGMLVEARSTTLYASAYSYADNTVNGDPVFKENYVIPDLPAGYYTVFVHRADGSGLAFRTVVYIWPGRTNWLDIPINPDTVG